MRHADALFDALRDPSVHEFIETSGPWTPETVRRRLERLAEGPPPGSDDVWLNYVVLLGERLVGRVEATVHGALAEVAYLFDPEVSGNGYATESVEWLLGHLRDDHAVLRPGQRSTRATRPRSGCWTGAASSGGPRCPPRWGPTTRVTRSTRGHCSEIVASHR